MILSVFLALRQHLLNRRKNKIFLSALLLAATLGIHNALALDCQNIPECAELGYSNNIQSCNGSWLYCPFNSNYKKCIPNGSSCDGFTDTDKIEWCNDIVPCNNDESLTLCASSFRCETGYSHGLTSANGCGTKNIGTKGWKLASSKVTATDGSSVTCNKCEALPCPGNSSTAITSRKDCDEKYGEKGYYDFNSYIEGYSGDKECHSCTGVQACDDIGLVDYKNSNPDCKEVSVLDDDQKMITCYDCSRIQDCMDAGFLPHPFEYGDYDCKEVSIWSSDGAKVICYDCDDSGGGSGSDDPLGDCIEVCKDNCKMNDNEKDCTGYDECVKDCQRRYG